MPEPRFALVRQRLLDGGIAPRRARRLLQELRAHFADLLAEQQRTGLPESAAAQAALQRLGSEESLAEQMLARPELRSWSRRRPWAVYALVPVLLFPAALALMFTAIIGIGKSLQELHHGSLAQFLKMLEAFRIFGLYILPALLAAGMGVLACRRRVALGWPLLSIALLALWGAATNMQVSARAVGAGVGLSSNPDKLARLLLYRWLPTVAAAGAVYAGALLLRRAMQRHALASADGRGGTDGGGGSGAAGSADAISE